MIGKMLGWLARASVAPTRLAAGGRRRRRPAAPTPTPGPETRARPDPGTLSLRGRGGARAREQRRHRGASASTPQDAAEAVARAEGLLRPAPLLDAQPDLGHQPARQRLHRRRDGRDRRRRLQLRRHPEPARPAASSASTSTTTRPDDQQRVLSTFNPSYRSNFDLRAHPAAAAQLQDRQPRATRSRSPSGTTRSPTCSSARPWSTRSPT